MATNQLKAGAVLNYIILLLNAVVGLLYTPFMLHCLGQSEYGLYSLVASIIAYLTLMDLGFGNAVIRYTAKYRAEQKTEEQYHLFGMLFVIYSIIALFALFVGLFLYVNVDDIFGKTMTIEELEKARIMMLILTFNLTITFIFQIFGAIITAYEDFVFQKTIQIIRIILNTLIMVLLLYIGYKAITMIVVTTIFNVLTLFINAFYCKYKLGIHLKFGHFDKKLMKEIAIYAFWIFLNAIMDRIYWSTGQFVLGAVAGTIAVSVFALAIHFESMYMSFSTAISGVFLPKITSMVATKQSNQRISDLFIRTGRIQYVVLAFILSGFIVFGKQFICLWAGVEYAEAYIIALMFFCSLLIPLIQSVGITILQARNQMKFRSLLYIVIAVCSLIAQYYLSQLYGAKGCAIAVAIALLIGQGGVMNLYYMKKQHLDIARFWHEIAKMSFVPLLLSLIGLLVFRQIEINTWRSLSLFVGGFTIIYLPSFWFFSMSKDEQKLFATSMVKMKKRLPFH